MVFLKAHDARNSANIILKLWLQKVSAQKKSRAHVKSRTRNFAESLFLLQRKEIPKFSALTIRPARHGRLVRNCNRLNSIWSLILTSERNQTNSLFLVILGLFSYQIGLLTLQKCIQHMNMKRYLGSFDRSQ